MHQIEDPTTRISAPKPTHGQAPSHSPPDTRYVPGKSLARFLGWFSIGLGAAELLAPRALSRITGGNREDVLQFYGAREIVTGIGILYTSRPTGWLWGRVAGDAVDLATLGANLRTGNREQRRCALVSAVAVAGVTALDVLCSTQLTAASALTDD